MPPLIASKKEDIADVHRRQIQGSSGIASNDTSLSMSESTTQEQNITISTQDPAISTAVEVTHSRRLRLRTAADKAKTNMNAKTTDEEIAR